MQLARSAQYLQNNSRYLARVHASGIRPTYGTTTNEATHKELKARFSNIWNQSLVRLHVVLDVFVTSKLLAWVSAAQLCLSLPCRDQASMLKRL
eukprot:1485083-Karenia_brevis.AAC.1